MIKTKTNIYVPELGKELDMSTYNTLKRANIPPEQMRVYEELFEKKDNFFKKVGKFLLAENKAGRRAKILKDFALLFFPWGKQVSNLTEFATSVLKPEQTPNIMDGTKKWYQSKTVGAIIMIIVLVCTQFFGIEITEAELQETITAVGIAIASVIALWGRFVAKDKIE